jgi:hypothetical protein
MNYLKPTPASIRYLKARLKPFKRPLFWSSLAVLTLVGYAIYQYWQHPELLEGNSANSNSADTTKNGQESLDFKSSLSPDELAVGADLDNVELLLTELGKKQNLTPSTSVDIKAADGQKKVDSSSLNQFKDRQKNLTQLSKSGLQVQQQTSQINGTAKTSFSEKSSPTGKNPIAGVNTGFSSLSPITNNYLGQKYNSSSANYGIKKSFSTKYNSVANPSYLPSYDPFNNLSSPSLRSEVSSQSQLNFNNNSNNYINSSPNPSSLPARFDRGQANISYPNPTQGSPYNDRQPSLNSNLAPSTLNPAQPQLTGNNNPYKNQTGYGYGSVTYGAPPSNPNSDRANPSSAYNNPAQANINDGSLRSNSLNNVDFNH